MISREELLKVEVLILGGGIAGLNAAIAAREQGADVLILDKAGISRSGNIGAGVDHFTAFLEEGQPWDTREAFLEYMSRIGRGAVDLSVLDAIFCQEVKAAIQRLKKMGNPLHDPVTGKYFRVQSFGQPGPYLINFKGKQFKPNLARYARGLGCQALEKVMVTSLLTEQGRVSGATAFHIRNGTFYIFRTKAIVLATGNANRLYPHPSGLGFNTLFSPYNTGDGQAIAFRAGSSLANMEYLGISLVPKGFSAAGLAAFIGMGCRLVNAQGEAFMSRYHTMGDKAPRYELVKAVIREIKEGRGPIYLDGRHLPSLKVAHLKTTLGWDKDTLPDYLDQKGVDLAKEPLEIMPSEGYQTGPTDGLGSGIRINARCASDLPGLFAAGDCADQARALHLATTSGYAAGREASSYAKTLRQFPRLNLEQARAEAGRVFKPLSVRRGMSHLELEEIIRAIMATHCSTARSEAGLGSALSKLNRLEQELPNLSAGSLHELMRTCEAENILTVAKLTCEAARFRRESRFGPSHHRIDYPETDDINWHGLVLIKKLASGLSLALAPLPKD